MGLVIFSIKFGSKEKQVINGIQRDYTGRFTPKEIKDGEMNKQDCWGKRVLLKAPVNGGRNSDGPKVAKFLVG